MKSMNFLDVELPIIQAPMAGVQDSGLAIAVSNAGGLGSLPCAMLGYDALQKELTTIKSQTSKPINLNFFCHTPPVPNVAKERAWLAQLQPYFDEYNIAADDIKAGVERRPFSHEAADILEDYKPAVVSFHFGLPERDLLARVQSWGSKVIASATTLEEALWLESKGIDGIIAQGLEAGGHRGIFLSTDLALQVGTFALLPQILQKVKIPVIAAGGIADSKSVEAALTLGATAVQVGTAYLLCPESKTSQLHRAALQGKHSHQTVVTNVFSGRPARGIVNRVIEGLGAINNDVPEFPLAASAIGELRKQAEMKGLSDFSPLWSGQNNFACKAIPAAELTRELVAGI